VGDAYLGDGRLEDGEEQGYEAHQHELRLHLLQRLSQGLLLALVEPLAGERGTERLHTRFEPC
jgi:hypothetical protein